MTGLSHLARGALGAVLGAALVLGGCGRATPGTEVVARVNGKQVPASRVRAAQEQGAATQPSPESGVRALERVIDQELLVQAALREGLDRDAQVRQSIDEARRRILAQAYVNRTAGEAREAGAAEVNEFYERNPSLFSRRRVYRFQELSLEGPTEKLAALNDALGNARSLDEVKLWLKERQMPFTASTQTRPAEQVPLHYLPRLAAMKDGDIAVFSTPSGAAVVQLVQSQQAPLTLAEAQPVIERFISARRRLQLAEEALGKLRSEASIEYEPGTQPGRQDVSGRGLISRAGTEIVGAGSAFGEASREFQ